MSNEFYRVRVKATKGNLIGLEVTLVDPSQRLPSTAGWALMTLHEATFTSLESSETPVEAKARAKSALAKALAGKELEAVCRQPGAWVSAVTVSAKKAKAAVYAVKLTDAKWGAHLTPGMCFSSSSYDVDVPSTPPPRVKATELKKILEGFATPALAKRVAAFRALVKLRQKLGHAFTDKLEGAEGALANGIVELLRERIATDDFAVSATELLRALPELQPAATPAFREVTAALFARGLVGDEGFAWVRQTRFTPDDWVEELQSLATKHEDEAVRIDAISSLGGGKSAAARAAVKKLLPWVKKQSVRKDTDRRKPAAYQFRTLLDDLGA
jgi:hypothetical protein